MIDHASVNITDFVHAKELYSKMLAPLGYTLQMDLDEYKTAGFGDDRRMDFWISVKPAAGTHIAFEAKNKEAVDAFHAEALKAGALDNGAPGYRKEYSAGYYAAFIHDLDGNNIEAVWMDPSK
jgi:catechol 2,3-dioxygenase-like lactoylglutathione lyase family enzyme